MASDNTPVIANMLSLSFPNSKRKINKEEEDCNTDQVTMLEINKMMLEIANEKQSELRAITQKAKNYSNTSRKT